MQAERENRIRPAALLIPNLFAKRGCVIKSTSRPINSLGRAPVQEADWALGLVWVVLENRKSLDFGGVLNPTPSNL
jgi:hypothetical protein